MNRTIIAFVSLCLLTSSAVAQKFGPPLVIKGGTLIDGTGKPPQPNVSILIQGGKIRAIGPTVDAPKDAETLDATGKYIIPGLWDARVQLFTAPGNRFSRAEVGLEERISALHGLLSSGVLYARIIQGSLPDQTFFQRWEDNNTLASPRLIPAGPTFTAPDGSPTEQYSAVAQRSRERETRELKDDDQALEKSREVAHGGAQVFEISLHKGPQPDAPLPLMSDEVLQTVVKEAHGHELKVFCWTGHNDTALKALQAGVDVIEGMTEEKFSPEVLAEMRKRKIAFLPALTFQGDFLRLLQQKDALAAYLRDPLVERSLSALTKKGLESATGPVPNLRKRLANDAEFASRLKAQQERAVENVRLAKAAGISIVAGTGAGAFLVFPGPALHRELQLLVQAGLTPMEALLAATRNAAAAVGKNDEAGTIEAGKNGDLVILNADALGDIKNAGSAATIIKDGRKYDPAEVSNY